MDKKDFKWLSNYIKEKDLQIGTHCTDVDLYKSIKEFGISHSGDISSTIIFNYSNNLEGLKTIKHKGSNCVVVVGIPKEFASKLYYYQKSQGESYFESNEFCEFAPKVAHLPNPFVLNPKYIVGLYNQEKDEFELNDNFLGEKKDYQEIVRDLVAHIGNRQEREL